MSKVLPTKGNLAWEYNPFRNYRIDSPKYYFRNKFFTKEELELELDPTGNTKIPTDESIKTWDSFRYPTLENGIHDYEDDPIFYDVNQLVDFDTDELTFDVNHPVDVLPQYSYDGSVNLIINDGKINRDLLILDLVLQEEVYIRQQIEREIMIQIFMTRAHSFSLIHHYIKRMQESQSLSL